LLQINSCKSFYFFITYF